MVPSRVRVMALHALPAAPSASRLAATELVEVRDRLSDAGLRDDGSGPVMDLAGAEAGAGRRPMVLAALHDLGDVASLLTRVFLYGDTASSHEMEAALGPTTLHWLACSNLLRTTSSGDLECPLQLRPLQGLLVASDRPGRGGDAVMPPGSTTLDLARALPPPPLGRVLDLGSGSGALALLAAAAGATVVATDINERACAFARFNAAFNGLAVTVRHGDLFAPVEGERFDLVVSQPPFIAQPPDIEPTAYAHGGPRGDEVALRILAGLDVVLAPGGGALLRFDANGTLDDVVSRVRGSLATDLDLGVFGFRAPRADVIALGYAVLADSTLDRTYRAEVTSYSRHMAALGLDHFTGTITAVHRATDERPPVTVSAAGRSAPRWPHIRARLAAERLAAAPDQTLMAATLTSLPGARLAVELVLATEAPPSYAIRYPSDAVPEDVELDEASAALMQLFVAGRAVASVVRFYAGATSKSLDEAAPEVLAFARDALRRGVLVPSLAS